MKYIYFGTPQFAATILDELSSAGFLPSLIVTSKDKPSGRKLALTPTPVKEWAIKNNIPYITPDKLREDDVFSLLKNEGSDLFIVAAYGKLIPQNILDIPKYGTLNVHPSLLPLLRGPSPVESSITDGLTETGVSIMKLDNLMDHGPIIAQSINKQIWTLENPPKGSVLENTLAHEGGKLIANILPEWTDGKIEAKEQDHEKATLCKKILKEDGLVDINGDPIIAIRKIRAYDVWPGAFYFMDYNGRNMRIRITEAIVEGGKLIIQKIIPEGKNGMNYQDFMRGLKK